MSFYEIMNRFIYEMVTLEPWGEDESRGFHVAYHFEDYFTSRKRALSFTAGYVEWILKEGLAKEAVQCSWRSKSGAMLALWRVFDGLKYEYYGVVRNLILD